MLSATGIRLSELAGLRCGDVDLWQRELIVRGKSGKNRIVKIGHQAARSLDRYLRARSRHAQTWRPQLWLGINNQARRRCGQVLLLVAADWEPRRPGWLAKRGVSLIISVAESTQAHLRDLV